MGGGPGGFLPGCKLPEHASPAPGLQSLVGLRCRPAVGAGWSASFSLLARVANSEGGGGEAIDVVSGTHFSRASCRHTFSWASCRHSQQSIFPTWSWTHDGHLVAKCDCEATSTMTLRCLASRCG